MSSDFCGTTACPTLRFFLPNRIKRERKQKRLTKSALVPNRFKIEINLTFFRLEKKF